MNVCYATRERAAKALIEAGFSPHRADIMGAAEFRRPGGYAWIEHDWSRKHCKMRYFVYARG
jgi:hypothetical protein